MANVEHEYDFQGATFDLEDPRDREIVGFILSQALFGEATGVYCGQSLYAARSLEAARFYVRQARQELNHLELFAEIFRLLEMEPVPGHWVIRAMSSHNHYYPLKVLMEHAIGEGMVLDIFKDVLLQTLPEDHPAVPAIKKKLGAVCREELEHVQWGEKETRWVLSQSPWLATPFYGILELQLAFAPLILKPFQAESQGHPVLSHLPAFLEHVNQRVWRQGQELGFVPAERPGLLKRVWAMGCGLALLLRSQLSSGRSTLDKTYLAELGFSAPSPPS
jgi:hypothetical protein